MARVTATGDTGMVIGASGKGARGVTNTTIFSGWHVVGRFTARSISVTGCAIIRDVAMVDECTFETIGVMARSTIVRGRRVGGYRRGFSWRINTIVSIVA